MNIYTVSFFGHRKTEDFFNADRRLEEILRDLVMNKEYVEFLIGRDGDFDIIASAAIKRAIKDYGCGNTCFTLVLPYIKSEYIKNEQYYNDYYDEIEVCEESAKAHFKAAFQIRNRKIVDRSDLVICYITHKSGGAYKTVQYAEKSGKHIINLAENSEIRFI